MAEEEAKDRERDDARSEGTGDVDAMGKEKRRVVIGKTYGPTIRKQLTLYGIAIGVIVLGVVGFLTVVSSIDNREMPLENTAPWSVESATLEEPNDLDYPRNGPQNALPPDEIVNR